jgi:prevent-host-death family protein
MAAAASVRELKNQTTALLRKVEKGTLVVVTRRGKPVATLKPFEEQDLHRSERYPTTLYDALRSHIQSRHPELARRTPEQIRRSFERITHKVKRSLPFSRWQEMDKALKGDRYGLTRQ